MEVTFIHGPGILDLEEYYSQHLKLTHEFVSIDGLYENHPEVGIRAVITAIVRALDSRGKVVVLDSQLTSQKLNSYVAVIGRKVVCEFKCLVFHAKYGTEQVNFMREFQRCKALRKSALFVESGPVDTEELASDGVLFMREAFPPQLETSYQLEVPCLFIQRSALVTATGKVVDGACQALKLWSTFNPIGYIIVISTRTEKDFTFMEGLCPNLEVPVFLCEGAYMDFMRPPNPGLLAFLTAFFHLDIRDHSSLYLHQTADEQQLAENIGIRHSNASKIWRNPSLVTSPSASCFPSASQILEKMTFKQVLMDPNLSICFGTTRLGNLVTKFVSVTDSVTLHIFAETEQCCLHFNELYVKHATLLCGSASRVKQVCREAWVKASAPRVDAKTPPGSAARSSRLPSWLLKAALSPPKKSKPSTRRKLEVHYVLSDDELLDMAQRIVDDGPETGEDEETREKMNSSGLIASSTTADLASGTL